VVIGFGAVCEGPTARHLGLLAACTGARREADEHFRHALAANAAMRAPVHLAHTQLDYAALLGRGAQARELIDAADTAGRALGLPSVIARAAQLRAR